MVEILSKKATVKNISGTNPVMIHPVSGTITIRPGESYTGEFPLGEIAAMDNAVQYDVTSAAEHKSADTSTDGEPQRKLTKEEKAAAKAAVPPAAPVVPPVAPALPGSGGLPSALQLPGSGN